MLERACAQLKSVSDTPVLDVQLLLSHVMGKSRTWVVAHGEAELSVESEDHFQSLVDERAKGVPLPYLLGWWEFYGRRFFVSDTVLIPRPETELLVEVALENIRSEDMRRIADIGTGSGCIAITLAAEVENLRVCATDISFEALILASKNANTHNVQPRTYFVQSDLTNAIQGPFDLVCANLPYIPTIDLQNMAVGKWEPRLALDGGEDGLHHFQELFADLPRVVREGGRILLEIESNAADEVKRIAEMQFPQANFHLYHDYSGNDRLFSVLV